MEKTQEGLIFNIQKFSVNDGGGIRTIVFLNGCPLRQLRKKLPDRRASVFRPSPEALGRGTGAFEGSRLL